MVFDLVNQHLGTIKVLNGLKLEAQTASCAVEPLVKKEENLEIVAQSNTTEVFNQVTPAMMTKEQWIDPVLCLVYQYMLFGNKLRPADVAKVKFKAAQKYLLQFDWLTLKKDVLPPCINPY